MKIAALVGISIVVVVCGVVAAALLAWPHARLDPASDALARVVLPGFAGRVTAVDVRSAAGGQVPVQLRQGKLWPLRQLAAGERLTVELTVRRPGWAGWLLGGSERRSFTIETPSAHLLGRWLQVKAGAPVTVAFDTPVALVSLGGSAVRGRCPAPQTVVPLGVVASGSHSAGAIEVAAAARSWERLPAPVRVSWFPAQPYPQLLAEPRPGATLAPGGQLTLTFSDPISDVLGAGRPRLSPATPGRWRELDAHTLAFQPSGLGFGLGEKVRVELPRAVHLAGQSRGRAHAHAPVAGPAGFDAAAAAAARPARLPAARLAAGRRSCAGLAERPACGRAFAAAGTVLLALSRTPRPSCARSGASARPNEITRGAVMMFEDTHGLAVDGLAGTAGLARAASPTPSPAGAAPAATATSTSTAALPQSLNLWHNGRVILSSPGNTGVPAAPTQLGTFPVFEHIPVGTMSGTNPDGSHYNDPGIRYISYFNRRRRDPRLQPRLLWHPAEPRLRRAAAGRRRQGLALHPDRHARHDRELKEMEVLPWRS